MPRTERATIAELVALLAPTLGQEKSEACVTETVRSMGILTDAFEISSAIAVLDALGKSPGMVGVVARFARTRFETHAPNGMEDDDVPISSGGRRIPSSQRIVAVKPRVARKQLVRLLAPTLGDEKADEVIVAALRRRKNAEDPIEYDEAIAVLEELTGAAGLVGVTARFAKARLMLLPSRPEGRREGG